MTPSANQITTSQRVGESDPCAFKIQRGTETLQKLTSLVVATVIGITTVGLIATQARAAPILDVVGGQLLGARNVSILGSLYDVEFKDGTCTDLFSGCDEASDFTFTTRNGATAAAEALLEQVFLDGIDLFDTEPELTVGCTSPLRCNTLVPYEFLAENGLFDLASAVNFPDLDEVRFGNGPTDTDLTLIPELTFAVFSPASLAPESIPEPASITLLFAGLLALTGLKRHRRSSRKDSTI